MSIDRGRWRWPGGAAVVLAALAMQGPAMAGDGVYVIDHGDGRYTLSTSLVGTSDPDHGGAAIAPKAMALCGDLFPHFGRYRFEGREPIEGQGNPGPTSLEYTQEITCRNEPQQQPETVSAPVPAAPDSPPTESDVEVIRALTLTYLHAKEAADANAAYALFSSEMASHASPEDWAATKNAFNTQVGPGARPNVARITWYDNPAADYGVAYPSNGFTCGYVVWLRQADGGYLVVREEEAQVTPDSVANLSAEQIASMRMQLQCRDQATTPGNTWSTPTLLTVQPNSSAARASTPTATARTSLRGPGHALHPARSRHRA